VGLIAVLDYGIGNLRSAEKALQKAGGDARLVGTAEEAEGAIGVVLPGVGAFGRCMAELRASGLHKVALDAVERGTPFMGICVGMQMLYAGSEEDPGVSGLGILEGKIRLLPEGVKRPQMQWNILQRVAARPAQMLDGLVDPAWVYFVHSYAAELTNDVVATCDYGADLVAAVERDNVWATQFHPEKSGRAGMSILENFVRRCQ